MSTSLCLKVYQLEVYILVAIAPFHTSGECTTKVSSGTDAWKV